MSATLTSDDHPKRQPVDEHDRGLPYDLSRLLSRRTALGWFAAAGAAGLTTGCGDLWGAKRDVTATGPSGECVVLPEETAGPFPADGSNRAHGTLANVLADSGIVRRDIRASLGKPAGVAAGTQLDLAIALVNVGASCAPLAGCAVYLWHCDAEGRYSIYDLAGESYLRGVAVTDAEGKAQFTTILPGCYPGRYPHMHFEVYPSLEKATSYSNRVLTSQLAMPADICRAVYSAASAYRASVASLARSPIERDGIFADGTPKQRAAQMASLKGEPATGLQGNVTIGLLI
jgi:protocatechuate 3,4-dioxygenase beta subunit